MSNSLADGCLFAARFLGKWPAPVFALLILAAAQLTWACEEQDAPEREEPDQKFQVHEASEGAAGFLWVFDKKKPQGNPLVAAYIRKKLARGQVKTPLAAKKTAGNYRVPRLPFDGLETGGDVVSLIRVGRDVPEFAKKWDFVWVVRYYFGEPLGGVSHDLWINAANGKIYVVLPVPK